jgi:hypothetical protein
MMGPTNRGAALQVIVSALTHWHWSRLQLGPYLPRQFSYRDYPRLIRGSALACVEDTCEDHDLDGQSD